MMLLPNGNWLTLAGNAAEPTEGGYDYRLAGVVAGGRIVERLCRVVPTS